VSLSSKAQKSSSGLYSISGKVTNSATGVTLGHSSVSLELAKDGTLVTSVITDENGEFQFQHLPADRYILRASHRGFLTSPYEVHEDFTTALVTGEGQNCCANLQMRLVPGGAIEGVVAEDSGDPVERAQITLYRETNSTDNGNSGHIVRVRTVNADETGSYEFTGLEPGNYFLAVNAQPWYALHARALPRTSTTADGSTDAARSPLDLVYATTFYPDTADESAAEPISIKGGERLRANFALHPVPAVHLTMRLPQQGGVGRQFTSFTVERQTFGSSEPVSSPLFMRNQSEMEISVAPGQYEVRMPGSDNSKQTSIDVTADQALNPSDTARSTTDVAGKFALVSGGALPRDIFVSLQTPEGQTGGGTEVDKDGSFTIHNVPAGTYRLNIIGSGKRFHVSKLIATGAQVGHHQITIGSNSVTLAAMLYPDRGLAVSGYAKQSGRAVPGAMIVLVPDDPANDHESFRRAQSDSDGNFVLKNVEPGRYTVVAIQDGWTLDWAQADTIHHYLPQGQVIKVTENSPQTTLLQEAVEVQNK
jgi:protocatechuate 3,4-dioxygenase beta subunit